MVTMRLAILTCFIVVLTARITRLSAEFRTTDKDGGLFLTPMIRDGKIHEARAACNVRLQDNVNDTVRSCAGYLTVDEAHGSNMFFWFFPAENGADIAPVLLWLQGGPGAPSLYSVFNEHGPYVVDDDDVLKLRQYPWTSTHSVLYVDNPVGVGYSFTSDLDGYSANQTAVGRNLYAALVQFFTLFPEYRDNDFYVAGESYAGKYIPAVSHVIHTNNPGAQVKINLKGLAIGNGLIDPVNQMVYSDYLYQQGIIDEDGKRKFEEKEQFIRDRIVAGDYVGAYGEMMEMMMSTPSLYSVLTGMRNIYNVMWNENPIPFESGSWHSFLQKQSTRSALHVDDRPWSSVHEIVYERLMFDIPRSVAPWLAELLDAGIYRVLLYSGQLDVIVPYRGTVNVAQSLQWSGAQRFKNATRTVWQVTSSDHYSCGNSGNNYRWCNVTISNVAGYATTYGPLTVLLVRNAGHMVPYDQPMWAKDMISKFTSGKSFS